MGRQRRVHLTHPNHGRTFDRLPGRECSGRRSFPQRWSCLKLEGPFPLSETGVLLSFIQPLSSNGVPIFAISTYDTDYVLIQEEWATMAIDALRQAGHELAPE